MQRYFAELDEEDVVQRVIVADSALWCIDALGGRWEETIQGHSTERYAAVGLVFVADDPRVFLTTQEIADAGD